MNAYMNLPICSPYLDGKSGMVSQLVDSIGSEAFKSLELQGFIKNAVSSEGNTWALTKEGLAVRNYFLGRPSLKTRILDKVCRYFLRMNVTV